MNVFARRLFYSYVLVFVLSFLHSVLFDVIKTPSTRMLRSFSFCIHGRFLSGPLGSLYALLYSFVDRSGPATASDDSMFLYSVCLLCFLFVAFFTFLLSLFLFLHSDALFILFFMPCTLNMVSTFSFR